MVTCELVRSPLEQPLSLNFVELSRDILPNDLERQGRLSVFTLAHERLYVEILGQVHLRHLHLRVIKGRLSMHNLVQNVAHLQLDAGVEPLRLLVFGLL